MGLLEAMMWFTAGFSWCFVADVVREVADARRRLRDEGWW